LAKRRQTDARTTLLCYRDDAADLPSRRNANPAIVLYNINSIDRSDDSMSAVIDVLLLPGLACDRAAWASQITQLHDVARCSVPAYGEVDSLPAMADAVLAAAPPRFALAGHSMGGRVALEVFRRARERVRGLALLDTGYEARPPGDAGERERAGRMELVELARQRGMRAMAQQWHPPMVHPDRLRDAVLVEAIVSMFERQDASVFEAQQRALLARPDATALLSEIACPTLVACGREDAWSPPSRHEAMARRIRGAQLAILERCGHMSTIERPDEVSAALRAWLGRVSPG
jgi:pimeloyl-ACP methyl ester carboxylesterase